MTTKAVEKVPEDKVPDSANNRVEELFRELQEKTDFDYYAVCHIQAQRQAYASAALKSFRTNFGDDWLACYQAQELFKDDPVIAFAPRTTTAIEWRTMEGLAAYEERHKSVLKMARDHDVHSGVFLSTRQLNGDIQLVSFANSRGKKYTDSDLQAASVYGQLVGSAIQAETPETDISASLNISSRELECLSLSARGKSSSEIEMILGISRHTVDFHIKNSMAKLDASTRTYAIVKALRMGLINP